MSIKTYSELISFETFLERFRYLKLTGVVGQNTFGSDRYINQRFYQQSSDWKSIRDKVIIRDNGCDLGIPGFEISGKIYVHHMNPLLLKDFIDNSEFLLNPEYLICTSHDTHNAIHYGNESILNLPLTERTKNDTCPWRH